MKRDGDSAAGKRSRNGATNPRDPQSGPLDAGLSAWSLGLDSPIIRRPFRPPELRHADFEDKYDFHTVFYDCFWSHDGRSLVLVGPPLANLAEELGLRFFSMPSGEECFPELRARVFMTEITLRVPQTLRHLRVESAAGTVFLAPQPNLSGLFAGRRVLMTLSQNNELEWIRDWVVYHQRLHGCDAALVYDNNSTRYDLSELRACLAGIPGITGLALGWPFRYGPFDGRLPLTYDLWEGHFCQFGMLEHARHRFLQEAACCLNLDIDELVVCPDGQSICDLTEASPAAYVKFGGKWVETYRSVNAKSGAMPLHRDFWHRKAERTQGCENKYAAVPSRIPLHAQFAVHEIYGRAEGALDDGIELRHFKALNTNWTVDRPDRQAFRTEPDAAPSGLAPDAQLSGLLKVAFAGIPRLREPAPPAQPDTLLHQLRQKSAGLLRSNRLAEAEALSRELVKASKALWPSLQLHHAAVLERQGETGPAAAERAAVHEAQRSRAKVQYALGNHRLHVGDFGGAARHLAQATRLAPDFAAAYIALARLFLTSGRQKAAERILRRALARVPSSARLHHVFAEVLMMAGTNLEALNHVDLALAADPRDGALLVLRARLLRMLRRKGAARAAARRAVGFQRRFPELVSRFAAAFDKPFEIAHPDLEDGAARAELILSLLALDDVAQADEEAGSLVADFPNRPYPHELRYLVLTQAKRRKAAAAHLAEATRLARRDLAQLPPQTLGRYKEQHWYESRLSRLYHLLLCAKQVAEATSVLERGLVLYPDSHWIAARLIDQYAAEKRAGDRRQLIDDSLRRFPRSGPFRRERARLREAEGDVDGAIADLRHAILLGSNEAWLKSHLGHLLLTRGASAEAEVLLREALASDPTHGLSHFRLGEVLWQKQEREAALDHWRKAARLLPGEAWMWSHLGGQLVEMNELAEGEKALRRAARLKPRDMLTLFRTGRLHEQRGEIDKALLMFAKATASGGSSLAWLWRHYAYALQRAGRTGEAQKAMARAAASA